MNSLLTKHLGRWVVLGSEVLRKSQPLFIGQSYSVLAQHKKAFPWLKRSCWSLSDGQVVSQRSIVTTPKEDFNSYLPKKKINIEDKVNIKHRQRDKPPMFWHPPPRRSEVHNLKRIIVQPRPTTRRLSKPQACFFMLR